MMADEKLIGKRGALRLTVALRSHRSGALGDAEKQGFFNGTEC
jgi:hypothetical protein